MPKPNTEEVQIQGPARITDAHVQDRILSKEAGSKAGWSRLSVFERAFRGDKLLCKERCTSDAATKAEQFKALTRYDAGNKFTELWLISQASIGGSMDFSRVRCAGTGVPFSETQFAAKTKLRAIETKLGTNDWMICRKILGEDYPIAQTIHYISPSYKDSTLARFREALDALAEVIGGQA